MERLTNSDLAGLMDRFGPAMAAGSVHVVSVEAIRERSGERWPRKREQVEAFIARTFSRVAGPGVLVTALNEVEYMSIQPDATGLMALNLSLTVLKETLTFFLGEAAHKDVRVFRVNSYTGGELQVEPVDSAAWTGDPEAQDAAARQAASAESQDAADGLGHLMTEIDHAVAATPRIVLQCKPEISVGYSIQPIWNIAQRVVTSYLMQPSIFWHARAPDAEESRFAAEQLALVGVNQAEARILEGLDRGARFAVHLPIPFLGAASAPARYRLQRHLGDLAPEVRKLLVLDLCGIDDGVPHSRMAETVGVLAPVCRAVLARAPSPSAKLSQWRQCRLAGISLDCSGLDPDDARAMTRLAAFAESANAICKTVVGYGLASRSLTLAAWAAGFTHVTGAAVRAPDAVPCSVRWDPANLYRDPRRSRATEPS